MSTIFLMVLAGCGCPDPERRTEEVSITDEEIAPYLTPAGDLDLGQCNALCNEYAELDADSCEFLGRDPQYEAANQIECSGVFGTFCTGRRPPGWTAAPADACDDPVGRWLAQAAELEAASVFAFEQLAQRLRSWSCPSSLVVRAEAAADDERRHAAQMSAHARAHGARPTVPACPPMVALSAEAFAIDNAVEGCVRETWGALLACYQARNALQPALRAMFEAIARDETRHAQLAHDLADWTEPRLGAGVQARVQTAARRAIDELRATVGVELDPISRRRLGLPTRELGLRMLDGLWRQLWGPAAAA